MTTIDDQLRQATPRSYPELDHEALQHRGRRRRHLARASRGLGAGMVLVLAVAVGSVLGGGTSEPPRPMVAASGIDNSDYPACDTVDGVYSTPEACADAIRSDVLAKVETDGSAFERSVLADSEVTQAEYEEAARRATSCMNQVLGEVVPGATVNAVRHATSLGEQYGFEYVIPDNDEGITPQQVDRAEEQVDAASCRQKHFDNVHHVWVAGMIAAQGSA